MDEMGPEQGGLRQITTKPEHAAIFRELESAEFKPGFMGMSEKDE